MTMTFEVARLLFHTKIVGVTFANDDGSSRQALLGQCAVEQWLSLDRDPKNPYDENAVKLCTREGRQLGYLSQECAADIAPLLDAGNVNLAAQITALTGGTGSKPTRGANIAVFERVEHAPVQRERRPSAVRTPAVQSAPAGAAALVDVTPLSALDAYVVEIECAYADGFVSVDELNACRRLAKSTLTPEMMKAAHAQVLARVLNSVARDGTISAADDAFVTGMRKVLAALGWSP